MGRLFGAALEEDASVGLSFTDRQLQSQLAQHGPDWGFPGTISNDVATRQDFLSVLLDHIDSSGTTRIEGTYRGDPAVHYIDPETGLNVFTTSDGGFWGAWRLSPAQIENVILRGSLR
jgi:hypothetical protein